MQPQADMATEGGGKLKNKRQMEHGKPYDRRKSIMSRMKESVKDMLAPSWLVDLVANVKRKTPPQSPELHQPPVPQRCVFQQSESGQTQPMSASVIASPMQADGSPDAQIKMMYNDSGASRPVTRTPSFQTITSTPAPATSQFLSDHLPFPNYDKLSTSSLIVNGGDDQSEMSEFSLPTTGHSSMLPQADAREYQRSVLSLSDLRNTLGGSVTPSKELEAQRIRGDSASVESGPSERSFLWSTEVNISQSTAASRSRRPMFNLSAFATPGNKSRDKSSIFGSDYQQSPYYSGKTTFGGAAAHKQINIRQTQPQSPSPYQVTPTRRKVLAKPLNTTLSGVKSSTAKRILDTLDRMSTPIGDAKKIPSMNSSLAESPLTFTPRAYNKRRKSTPANSISKQNLEGPPPQGLVTPRMASVVRNMHQPMPRSENKLSTTESTNHTQKNESSRGYPAASRQDELPGGKEPTASRSGKMKRERGGQHYSSRRQEDDEEEVEIPDLPTDYVLPMTNMPKFNFSMSSSPASTVMTASGASPLKNYKFSDPIPTSRPPQAQDPSPKIFQFSSPIHVNASNKSDSPESSVTVAGKSIGDKKIVFGDLNSTSNGFTSKVAMNSMSNPSTIKAPVPRKTSNASNIPQSNSNGGLQVASGVTKAGSVMDILGNDAGFSNIKRTETKQGIGHSAGFGVPAASQLKKGSVMDVLGASPGLSLAAALRKGSVMDVLGNSPASSSNELEKLKKEKDSLASLFKTPEGSWDCPTCMVVNKSGAAKCCACDSPKPSPPPTLPTQPEVSGVSGAGSLSEMFRKPEGSWTCQTCMIQNKPDTSACVACETPKPAKPTSTSATSQIPNSKLSKDKTSISEMFRKPVGGWECPTCLIQNNPGTVKCPACQTAKPGKPPPVPNTSVPLVSQTTSGPSLAEVFKKPADSWTCPTCEIQNKSSSGNCVACSTPSPSTSSSSVQINKKPAAVESSAGSLGVMFMKSEGSWECDTCMVVNKPDASRCIACEASRPGMKRTSSFTSPGGFRFDSADSSKSSAKGGKQFGSSVDAKTSDLPSSGGFAFNAISSSQGFTGSSVTARSPKPKPGAFSSKPTPPEITDSSKPTTGGFQFNGGVTDFKGGITFGQPLVKKSDNDKKDAEAKGSKPSGGFSFSGGPSSTPAFSGGPSSTPTADTKPTKDTISDSKTASAGFKFGPSASESNKSVAKEVAPSQSGGFLFGGSSTSTSSVPVSSSASTSGMFSFGSVSSTNSTSSTTSSTTASTGGFGFGAPKTTEVGFGAPKTTEVGFGAPKTTEVRDVKSAAPFSFSVGGEQVVADTKPAAEKTAPFMFSASQSTENKPAVFGNSAAPKSTAGGFSFSGGQPSNAISTSATTQSGGLFTFGAPVTTTGSATQLFGKRSGSETDLTKSPTKRSRDEMVLGSTSGEDADSGLPLLEFATGSSLFTPGNQNSGFAFNASKVSKPSDSTPSSVKSTVFSAPTSTPVFGGTSGTQGSLFGGSTQTSSVNFGSTNSSSMFNTPGQSATSTPAFGSTATPSQSGSAAPAFGSTGGFGAGSTSSTTSTIFGGAPAGQPSAANALSAGASTFGTAGAAAAAPAASSFSAQPSFQFNSTTAAPAAGLFQFGGKPDTSAQPGPAAPAPQFNASPAFNFSGNPPAPAAPTGNGPFQFSANAPQAAPVASNPFSVQSNPTGPRRPMKKAVRKLRK